MTRSPNNKQPCSAADEQRLEFFNERAEEWLDLFYKDPEQGTYTRHDDAIARLISLAEMKPGGRIIDVGCGSGILVPHVLERIGPAGELWEVDYAENMIAENRRRHADPRLKFLVASVYSMPAPSRYFDTALCMACFPHFERKLMALAEICRVLKPGGRLFIAHLASSREINNRHRKHPAVSRDRLPSAGRMRRLLQDSGFRIGRFIDEPGFYCLDAATPISRG